MLPYPVWYRHCGMVVEAGSCDIRQPCCMRRIESIVSCIENGSAKEIRMESTISTKDLKAKLGRKEGISVVETLAPERYREAHIPGALNIPPERIKELAPQLLPNKDTEIVTYCTNNH